MKEVSELNAAIIFPMPVNTASLMFSKKYIKIIFFKFTAFHFLFRNRNIISFFSILFP